HRRQVSRVEEQPVRELSRRAAVEAPRDQRWPGAARGAGVQPVRPRARRDPGTGRAPLRDAAAAGPGALAVDAGHGSAAGAGQAVGTMTRRAIAFALVTTGVLGLAAAIAAQGVAGTARVPGNVWPPAKPQMPRSIALSPQEEMQTFSLPPGFHVELVASEPLIESPILMDFDSDGRLWVVEMPTFLPDTSGGDSKELLDRVSVLEHTDGDGIRDRKTVFADKLAGPRALKVLEQGVLIGDPPNLWLMKDTDGDLKADTRELVTNTFGNPNGGIEHNANSLF